MEQLFKEIFHKIVDELAEKGRAEIEIRGTLSKHGDRIHNLELILKDKVNECELNTLKERVLILEQEQKLKSKNKTAMVALLVSLIGAAGLVASTLLQHFMK